MTFRPQHKWLALDADIRANLDRSKTFLYSGQKVHSYEGNYIAEMIISSGDFGSVYKVKSFRDGKSKFAVKIEQRLYGDQGKSIEFNRMKNEIAVYEAIQAVPGTMNKAQFLKLIDQGETKEFNLIVLELAGFSLQDIRRKMMKGVTTVPTIIQIARHTLDAIEAFHLMGFVHGDIKPENFVVGNPPVEHMIYIIDFAMAEIFTETDRKTRKPKSRQKQVGTGRFWSRAFHEQKDPKPVDDVESWCFMIAEYFDCENIIWSESKDTQDILTEKVNFMTAARILLEENILSFPFEFVNVVEYIEKMSMKGSISYEKIHKMIDQMVKEEKIEDSLPFDWIGKKMPCLDEPATETKILIQLEENEMKEKKKKEEEAKRKKSERERRKKQALMKKRELEQKMINTYNELGEKKTLEEIQTDIKRLRKARKEKESNEEEECEGSEDRLARQSREASRTRKNKERKKERSTQRKKGSVLPTDRKTKRRKDRSEPKSKTGESYQTSEENERKADEKVEKRVKRRERTREKSKESEELREKNSRGRKKKEEDFVDKKCPDS